MRRRSVALNSEADLGPLLERMADARIVMLGEASHGTHEFYVWRARITRRLMQENGFDFMAVEGDWPDCAAINRAVRRHSPPIEAALGTFGRWPTWMWANWEVAALAEWMRSYNASSDRAVGFYGLDVYSLFESIDAVLRHLQGSHPAAVAEAARAAYQCFEPYRGDPVDYARATALVPTGCEDEVVQVLTELRKGPSAEGDDPGAHFEAEMNAWAATDAERYYRAMIRGSAESWNIRDIHMMSVLDRLLEYHGPSSKAVVWAHNTHIGDARFTDMARGGMVNIGELARERYGEDAVFLLGFGTYAGTVVAGGEWGAPMERMEVPPAEPDSWEHRLHQESTLDRAILDFGDEDEEVFGHRAIGVVYDPRYERFGNYVPTFVPRRYDSFVYLDRTQALHPLHPQWAGSPKQPDTYPFAV